MLAQSASYVFFPHPPRPDRADRRVAAGCRRHRDLVLSKEDIRPPHRARGHTRRRLRLFSSRPGLLLPHRHRLLHRRHAHPEALVTLTLQADPVIQRSVKTEALGLYLFRDLPAATLRLEAAAPGFISPGPPDQRGVELVVTPDSLSQDGPPLTLDLTLQTPAALGGTITASGAPIAGATISLLYARAQGPDGPIGPFELFDQATTDAQGVYALEAIARESCACGSRPRALPPRRAARSCLPRATPARALTSTFAPPAPFKFRS